jgi:predicted DNA binding CopG/RHH family protein
MISHFNCSLYGIQVFWNLEGLMRTQIQDTPVRFRVNRALHAAAEAKAAREGMNLSEFMRSALRHQLKAA